MQKGSIYWNICDFKTDSSDCPASFELSSLNYRAWEKGKSANGVQKSIKLRLKRRDQNFKKAFCFLKFGHLSDLNFMMCDVS